MPTKWLQQRAKGSKNGHGMPPHRAFCGSITLSVGTSLSLSLPLSLSRSIFLSLTLFRSLLLSCALFISLFLALSLSLSRSLACSLSFSRSISRSLSPFRSHSASLNLSAKPALARQLREKDRELSGDALNRRAKVGSTALTDYSQVDIPAWNQSGNFTEHAPVTRSAAVIPNNIEQIWHTRDKARFWSGLLGRIS